ncbi:hypothetical protein [Paenibacillus polymyxa]|nr:hypothetical protein [Paenibacillus polymyxa]
MDRLMEKISKTLVIDFSQQHTPERLTYWGCRLFDNHADAAVSFG